VSAWGRGTGIGRDTVEAGNGMDPGAVGRGRKKEKAIFLLKRCPSVHRALGVRCQKQG
jgi:hypothetical protein